MKRSFEASLRTVLLVSLFTLVGILAVSAPAFAVVAPETPVTKPASSITGTGATLNGELNPNATASAGYLFNYDPYPETCTAESFTPVEPEQTGKAIKVSATLTGLEGNTEYFYCVVAYHVEEELAEYSFGPLASFKTLALAPVIVEVEGNTTETSNTVTPFAATLEAQVNPENQATESCVYEYGETTSYDKTFPCEQGTLEGGFAQGTSAHLIELTPSTTYHYRLVVKNATGESKGPDEQFTTLVQEAPAVTGDSSSGIGPVGATLSATINPNYQETKYKFEYATSEEVLLESKGTVVEGASPLPAEFAEVPVSVSTGALQPRTKYYYRAVATNAKGTTAGSPIESFTTLATPIVTTGEAEDLGRTSAIISGSVNPGGTRTTFHIAYVEEAGYEEGAENPYAEGQTTEESAEVGSDFTAHAVGPTQLRELQPGTTYHYAVVATNATGTTIGPDMTFTTDPPTPPLATTGAASGVTQISATINGTIQTGGLPTSVYFELGSAPKEADAAVVPATITSSSGNTETVSAKFNEDLTAGTTLYYRVVAYNQDGESEGAWLSFTTASFPSAFPAIITFQPVTAPTVEEPKSEGRQEEVKTPTRAEKLKKALKACKKKSKKKRPSCEHQAKKKYGPVKKKK